MPFHVDAYLGDTTGFTTIEHGAYLLLLFAMWRGNGGVPNDDKRLARITHLSLKQWLRVKPTIMRHCVPSGAFLTQPMLLKSIDIVRQKSSKASDSARARWLKHKGLPAAFAVRAQSVRNANQIKEIRERETHTEPEQKNGQAREAEPDPKVVDLTPSPALLATLNRPRLRA